MSKNTTITISDAANYGNECENGAMRAAEFLANMKANPGLVSSGMLLGKALRELDSATAGERVGFLAQLEFFLLSGVQGIEPVTYVQNCIANHARTAAILRLDVARRARQAKPTKQAKQK